MTNMQTVAVLEHVHAFDYSSDMCYCTVSTPEMTQTQKTPPIPKPYKPNPTSLDLCTVEKTQSGAGLIVKQFSMRYQQCRKGPSYLL